MSPTSTSQPREAGPLWSITPRWSSLSSMTPCSGGQVMSLSMNSAHLIIVHSPGCKHIAGCVLVSHCSFAFIVQGNNVYFLSEKWDNDENAL